MQTVLRRLCIRGVLLLIRRAHKTKKVPFGKNSRKEPLVGATNKKRIKIIFAFYEQKR